MTLTPLVADAGWRRWVDGSAGGITRLDGVPRPITWHTLLVLAAVVAPGSFAVTRQSVRRSR